MTNRHPEIVLPDAELQRELRKKSRRGFLVGGLSALGAFGAYKAVRLSQQDDPTCPGRSGVCSISMAAFGAVT